MNISKSKSKKDYARSAVKETGCKLLDDIEIGE